MSTIQKKLIEFIAVNNSGTGEMVELLYSIRETEEFKKLADSLNDFINDIRMEISKRIKKEERDITREINDMKHDDPAVLEEMRMDAVRKFTEKTEKEKPDIAKNINQKLCSETLEISDDLKEKIVLYVKKYIERVKSEDEYINIYDYMSLISCLD